MLKKLLKQPQQVQQWQKQWKKQIRLLKVPKKITATVIRSGNLPLQGIKEFVIIAINLSRGELIILHPVTPAALHPKPMHIVRACFPDVHAFLNKQSKLKAIRGKYPKSSNKVNSGKNIAIGGSITEITQNVVL